MKIEKEIIETHIAYFKGDIKIKYRGKRIHNTFTSKNDFYEINIYSSEIYNTSKISESDYKNLKQENIKIDLNDVLIEKPDNYKELFNEDLTDIKIFEFSNRSFNRNFINYGVINGKVFFQIHYSITKTILVDLPYKTSKKKKPPKTENEIGCMTIIGISIIFPAVFLILIALIKIWKESLTFALIFGAMWVFSYLGNYVLKAIKYIFVGIFSILILGAFLVAIFKYKPMPKVTEDDNTTWEDIDYIDNSDTLNTDSISGKDSISYKTLEWKDYNNIQHSFKYKISKQTFEKAKRNRADYISYNNSWNQIYNNLYSNDSSYLKDFFEKYKSFGKNLSRKKFAEIIVSSIQYQPYVWILNVSCDDLKYKDEIDQSGCSCLGYITRYAVQSPYEYITNQKGDCDTRSLILYATLKYYNYDVVLMTSDYYEHAIIGINIPSRGKYKRYRGKKYYVWETTVKDMGIGQLNASISNMNLWKVSL